jgi:hypothetical protein
MSSSRVEMMSVENRKEEILVLSGLYTRDFIVQLFVRC